MTLTLEVYEADGVTLVDTIDAGQFAQVKYGDPLSDAAAGMVRLPLVIADGATNPAVALCTDDRIIRIVDDGLPIGQIKVEDYDEEPHSPDEERGEFRTIKGRHPVAADFDKTRWLPDAGLGNLPYHPRRDLDYSADDLRDDDPDGPQGVWDFGVGNLPDYDDSNYYGRPEGFIDTAGPDGDGPEWLADRDARVAAPGGDQYGRQRFTLADETDMIWQMAADDFARLKIDNVLVLTTEGVYKGQCVEARLTLSAGEHLIAWHLTNLNELATGIVYAGWSVSDSMADGCLVRSDATTCRVLGYPEKPPGFTPTEVIRLFVAEAQARGMLLDLDLSFISASDTDHAALQEVIDIAVKAPADSGLTTLLMLGETYLDWYAEPEGLELGAWIRGTKGNAL